MKNYNTKPQPKLRYTVEFGRHFRTSTHTFATLEEAIKRVLHYGFTTMILEDGKPIMRYTALKGFVTIDTKR